MENIIDRIIKTALYLLVFLFPIFFLPLTISQVAWNKQFLLAGICFLVSVLWLAKMIKTGKANLVWNKVSLSVLILLVVLGISTLFSIAKVQSFWGTSVEPDTFLNFILHGATFFLFANLISKKEIFKIIKLFVLSSGILALLFLVQEIFGVIGFNLIGSSWVLVVFLGGVFTILVSIFTINRIRISSTEKILGYIIGILLFITILLVNFWVVWLGLVFSMVLILWIKLKSINSKEGIKLKDYFLPLIIFAIALILIFIKLPLGNILDLSSEINLTNKASLDIVKKTLNEGIGGFVLGSGPATFGYKYSLYRSTGLNLTDFWSLRFEQASSVLTTILTTSGILGGLAVLFLMGIFLYQGFINLKVKNPDTIILFTGGFYFLILWIFYSINFSLMFAGFLMLGLWVASLNKRKEISLVNPPQRAFFSMLGAIILMVLLIAGFYVYTQRYSAALAFDKGIDLLKAEDPNLNKVIININSAGNLAKNNDKYFRELSQVFLFKIKEILNNQDIAQEQKQIDLQGNISNTKKIIQKAIEVNPKNSLNWLQAGRIYEDLMLLSDTADQSAILAYTEAMGLDPQNPRIPFNLGRTYKSIAQKIQQNFNDLTLMEKRDKEKVAEFRDLQNQTVALAINNFQKSIELKPNFIPAYYLLGQIYEATNRNELAIQSYQMVLQLEPGSEEIRERLERLME